MSAVTASDNYTLYAHTDDFVWNNLSIARTEWQCLECPEGAACGGGYFQPVAIDCYALLGYEQDGSPRFFSAPHPQQPKRRGG